MRRCLEIAREALLAGNPPVGSLIVWKDRVLGVGREAVKENNDITHHAEIEAVRDAISNGHQALLNEATLYTTHEPCIMCSYVLRHHGIPSILCGCLVPSVGGHSSPMKVLDTESIGKWGTPPNITFGVLQRECEALTEAYTAR